MTEPTPENSGADIPPLDFTALTADDAPPIVEPPAPDHRASRERRSRRILSGKPAGDKPDTKAPRARAAKPNIPNRKGQFVEPLTAMYTTVGAVMMPFDPVCGNAVVQSAENCAIALDDLAYRNDAVRRAIFALTQTSALGAVIAAHLPIILAIVVHHVPAAQNVLGAAGANMAEDIERQMRAQQEGGTPDAA